MSRRIHLMGIGGAGVSAIARLLLARGDTVSGCDERANEATEALTNEGATIVMGHDAAHVRDVDLVVYSGAVKPGNVELRAARRAGIEVRTRAEMLADLVASGDAVAVAGTHGKTTITHMLGSILVAAGRDPSVLVGDGRSSRVGASDLLVAEADESDGTLVLHHPRRAIVTNMELDHPDHFAGLDAVRQLFADFLAGMPADGLVVACVEEPEFGRMPTDAKVVTYGIDAGDYRWNDLGFELGVPGRHNRLNACGAAAMALEMGVPREVVGGALAAFTGAHRRLERIGSWRGTEVYDDYGHHPTEVAATLAAARELVAPGGRLVLVFQPHRYSRFATFASEFPISWREADAVLVTPVYAAGEERGPGPGPEIYGELFAADPARRIEDLARPGDLVLFMGAGDIGKVARDLVRNG